MSTLVDPRFQILIFKSLSPAVLCRVVASTPPRQLVLPLSQPVSVRRESEIPHHKLLRPIQDRSEL